MQGNNSFSSSLFLLSRHQVPTPSLRHQVLENKVTKQDQSVHNLMERPPRTALLSGITCMVQALAPSIFTKQLVILKHSSGPSQEIKEDNGLMDKCRLEIKLNIRQPNIVSPLLLAACNNVIITSLGKQKILLGGSFNQYVSHVNVFVQKSLFFPYFIFFPSEV